MRGIHLASVFCLSALLGCADPAQFQQPITSFASASDSAATSFSALDATSAANLTTIRTNEALLAKRVLTNPDACTSAALSCALYFHEGNATDLTPIYYSTLMPHSVAFVNGIRDYAKALDALEKADATADVQAAFAVSMGAIAGVAGALNVPAAAATNAMSKPLTAVVGWGFGQYQNSIKRDALQQATKAADAVIQEAVPILSQELKFASQAQIDFLEKDFHTKDDAFSAQPTESNLKAEIQSANALNAALIAKSPDLFATLAAAHSKLTAAVEDQASVVDATTTITAFAQQAQNLQHVVTVSIPSTKN